MNLVFATSNKNKVAEIQRLIPSSIVLSTLQEIGCHEEIPETRGTLEGNASQKAEFVRDNYGLNCFAEDTGLEIEALNGEPGVYSARYAGESKSSEDNMDLVLEKMKGIENRAARFRTVISLLIDGKEYLFEGIVNGTIREERSGTGGFGYDPIFQPNDHSVTFSEMSTEEKNKISHRGHAVRKLVDFLSSYAS